MSEWQSIKTAPNNTPVLVCGFGVLGYYVADAKKIKGEWFLYSPEQDAYCVESGDHTHWMPLPPPPESKT